MAKKTVWDLLDELEEASEELVESLVEEMREDIRRILRTYPAHVYGTYEACLTQEPAYTVNETEDEYRIVVDLPYADPNKIRLKLVGRTLLVSAQTSREVNGRCVVFEARIPLNRPVDRERSSARFAKGLLIVKLKKQSGVEVELE